MISVIMIAIVVTLVLLVRVQNSHYLKTFKYMLFIP